MTGTPRYITIDDVLNANVPDRTDDDCWEWQGNRNEFGYGRVHYKGAHRRAHRVVYEEMIGPIPEGLVLRHQCDNPPCVNPNHLEPGTHKENSDDCWSRGRGWTPQMGLTECHKGHPFDEANTGFNKSTGKRYCRTCKNERQRRYRGAK
jgi:hypothetical protein